MAAPEALPPGKATIKFDFKCDGGGMGNQAAEASQSGSFRLEKKRGQWMFTGPDGRPMLALSVTAIYFNHPGLTNEGKSYTQIVDEKYRKPGDEGAGPARER